MTEPTLEEWNKYKREADPGERDAIELADAAIAALERRVEETEENRQASIDDLYKRLQQAEAALAGFLGPDGMAPIQRELAAERERAERWKVRALNVANTAGLDGDLAVWQEQDAAHPAPEPTEDDHDRVLRDQSVIVSQDAAVFAKIAEWQNAPSNTASAHPAPEPEEDS